MIPLYPLNSRKIRTSALYTLRLGKGLMLLVFFMMLVMRLGFAAEARSGVAATFGHDLTLEGESPASAASSPTTRVPAERIVDGKVRIRRVELRGDVLFPQYGITNEFIRQQLNAFARARSSWMSISEMHRLADKLTVVYHDKGLTFNQVFVLPQEIRDETLTLNVLAGRLAEVNIMKNDLYTRDQISAPFEPLLGQVVYEPAVRQAVSQVNAMPGLKVFGFYSVGRRQGETRLNLRVQQEKPAETFVRIDNWGVQDTGVARASLGHSRNNVAGLGDQLQMTAVATNESGNLYGGIQYGLPLSAKTRFSTALSSNQFEIAGDLAQFGLEGHLLTLQFAGDSKLLNEQNAKAHALLNIGFKQSLVTSDEFRDVFEEDIDYITLEAGVRMSVMRTDIRLNQGLYLAPLLGHVTKTNSAAIDSEFWGVRLNYSLQHLWSAAMISGQLTSLNLNALATSSVIPDAERMSLTGATSVRGYEPALFSADQAYRIGLEHIFAGWKSAQSISLAPFIFLDGVYGMQNDEYNNTASFIAAGIGLEAERKNGLSGRVTLGFPLSEQSSLPLAQDTFEPIIYGHFGLQF